MSIDSIFAYKFIMMLLPYCLFDLDRNCYLTVCICRFTTQSARNGRNEIKDRAHTLQLIDLKSIGMAEEDKARRRQRKGVITRHLSTLERLAVEEDGEAVQNRQDCIKRSFSEFEAAHDIYHNALEIDNDIEASDAWFDAVQNVYVAGVKAAKVWLKTQAHVDPSAPTVTREDFLNYMHVPKVELDKFDGNPPEYLTFIAVFDEMVDRKVTDGQVKLTRLLQYTSGPAKSAIKNCALIGGVAASRL